MPSEIKRNNRCKGVRREWLHGVGLILVEESDMLDKNVSKRCFLECVCNEVGSSLMKLCKRIIIVASDSSQECFLFFFVLFFKDLQTILPLLTVRYCCKRKFQVEVDYSWLFLWWILVFKIDKGGLIKEQSNGWKIGKFFNFQRFPSRYSFLSKHERNSFVFASTVFVHILFCTIENLQCKVHL